MNYDLIKHIIFYDNKWRKKPFKALLAILVVLLIIVKYTGFVSNLLPVYMLCGFFVFILSVSSNAIFSLDNTQGQASQGAAFSWKYIHTLINDRKSFIVGFCLAGVPFLIPVYIFVLITMVILKIAAIYYIGFAITFTLSIFLFRLITINSMINRPRKFYYLYNKKKSIISFFEHLLTSLHKIAHFFSPVISSIFLVIFCGRYQIAYGFVALVVSLIFLIYIIYINIMKTWADENFSQWITLREAKKTILYFFLIAVTAYLNIHFHGYIYREQDPIFDLINDNKLDEIKRQVITPKLLKSRSTKGRTPIQEAVYFNKLRIVEYLLQSGADIEDPIKKSFRIKRRTYSLGMTPLMIATNLGHVRMVKFLLKKRANYNATADDGMTVLSLASFRCNLNIMEVLIEKGADINKSSKDGFTPLFYSAKGKGCLTGLLYLEKVGANKLFKNKNGKTYLEYALDKNPLFYKEVMFYKNKLVK